MKMRTKRTLVDVVIYGGAIVLALLALIAAWVIPSMMEAAAYNRVTGENVSTWDAMWVELRVQAGPR